jgi:hypothetical protein
MPEAVATKSEQGTKQPRSSSRGAGQHPQGNAPGSRHSGVMALHRTAGNRAVSSLLEPHVDRTGLPPTVANSIQAPGQPLDRDTREFMESRFGKDFGHVRLHTDAGAADSALSVNADAYTVGNHIVFGTGLYAPESPSGRLLLAHELAHVVQQSRGGSAPAPLPGSGTEQSAQRAAWGIVHDTGFPVSVVGNSAPGIARQAKSLSSTVDPKTLSDDDLERETLLVSQWLSQHAAVSDPQSDHMMNSLKALEAEAHRRHAKPAAAAPKNPLLPPVQGDDKQQLINVMAQIDQIAPSKVASGLYTVVVKGQSRDVTQQQVEEIRQRTRSLLKESIGAVTRKADNAIDRYQAQEEVDKDHWIVSSIVKTLGRIKDPGPFLMAKASQAKFLAIPALANADANQFTRAAQMLAEAETLAAQAQKMWEAYFDGIISAAEMTVTVLEVTQKVAFTSLAILATVATAGGAAGLTSIAGLEIGSVSAANLIATGAPLLAKFGQAAEKAAYGDKVDWGELAVDAVVTVVLYKFGGKLSQSIAGRLVAQNPALRSMGQRVVAGAVSNMITGKLSTVFSTGAHAAYAKLSGQQITWEDFTNQLADQMTDPGSTFTDALVGGLLGGAQAKGEGLGMKPKGAATTASKAPASAAKAKPPMSVKTPEKPAPAAASPADTPPAVAPVRPAVPAAAAASPTAEGSATPAAIPVAASAEAGATAKTGAPSPASAAPADTNVTSTAAKPQVGAAPETAPVAVKPAEVPAATAVPASTKTVEPPATHAAPQANAATPSVKPPAVASKRMPTTAKPAEAIGTASTPAEAEAAKPIPGSAEPAPPEASAPKVKPSAGAAAEGTPETAKSSDAPAAKASEEEAVPAAPAKEGSAPETAAQTENAPAERPTSVEGEGTSGKQPSTPKWNDPTMTEDEQVRQYKESGKSPMDEQKVRQKFKEGMRYDTETSRWKKPAAAPGTRTDVRGQYQFDQYERGGQTYKEARGRLGNPNDVERHRSQSQQRNVAGGTGDDAGHLIGNRFGSPGGEENLTPQNWKTNRFGTFKDLENLWAAKRAQGIEIDVRVTDVTKKGADRPFMRNVQWTETAPDGTPTSHELDFANTQTPESRENRGVAPTNTGQPGGKVIEVDFQQGKRVPSR